MRAAILRNSEIVVDDTPIPEPGKGEVLVKTLACGICGSDLHARKQADEFVDSTREAGGIFVWDTKKDVVFGHEFCGEIVDYGPGTSKTKKIGAKICSVPMVGLGEDTVCVGYSNDAPGGYGEYMRLNEDFLIEVPDGLSAEHAALTEPMAVGWHAIQKANISKADVPLVIGCGPVGLAVIAGLRMIDSRPIIAADFSPGRRALALKAGADVVVDPNESSPYETWAEMAGWKDELGPTPELPPWVAGPALRPSVIFECVGVPGIINNIMRSAPGLARIVVVGVCMHQDSFQPLMGINKELNIQFVLAYSSDEFQETLHNIADGKYPVEDLVTGVVGLDGVAQAFTDLECPWHHAKIMVQP